MPGSLHPDFLFAGNWDYQVKQRYEMDLLHWSNRKSLKVPHLMSRNSTMSLPDLPVSRMPSVSKSNSFEIGALRVRCWQNSCYRYYMVWCKSTTGFLFSFCVVQIYNRDPQARTTRRRFRRKCLFSVWGTAKHMGALIDHRTQCDRSASLPPRLLECSMEQLETTGDPSVIIRQSQQKKHYWSLY